MPTSSTCTRSRSDRGGLRYVVGGCEHAAWFRDSEGSMLGIGQPF